MQQRICLEEPILGVLFVLPGITRLNLVTIPPAAPTVRATRIVFQWHFPSEFQTEPRKL